MRLSSVLKRFQVLDEIGFLLLRQFQAEELVVVLDNIPQRGKAPIMIKAAFLMVGDPVFEAIVKHGASLKAHTNLSARTSLSSDIREP